MRDYLADWALRRARAAALDAYGADTRRHFARADRRADFWCAVVLWLDGAAP